MPQLVLLLLLLVSSLWAKEDINKRINATHSKMHSYNKKYSNLNNKMSQTAKAILKREAEIKQQEEKILALQTKLESSQEAYQVDHKELLELQDKQKLIKGKQGLIEKELIQALARNISIDIIQERRGFSDQNDIMTQEILKELNQKTQERITTLESSFSDNASTIEDYKKRTLKLESAIKDIDDKKAMLILTQKENQIALKKLTKDKANYKHSMQKLMAQKSALNSTLARLNIIKSNEQKRRKQEALTKKKKSKRTSKQAKVTKKGSSYQNIKSKKYKGKRTVAPLSSYRLVKKFGPYTDPIYKIKIYNESVTLRPKHANAKVKSVFNGKVVLAKKTPLLENVVIIKHSNGLHTIYAHLDQIAPNIKKGSRVKKGAIIGRVNSDLVFEVTQNNYHIDPMTMIKK